MTGLRRFLLPAVCAAALLLSAVPAAAQVDVTTGRISGSVVDEGGQPLPGAGIEARNKGTGLTLTGVSDARGLFRIVSVPVGSYAVTASLQGFTKQTEPNVVITLGSAPTVDFRLRVSTKTESVTVTASEAVIETTQTSSQTTIDNNAIRSLPINGRNFTDFVLLAPNSQRETQRGNIAIGGQRGINTSVTLDGVDYNDAFFGGSSGDGSAEGRAPFTVSQESVREFQVIQNGASVEFGRSGGGFVNVITKSGSNEFHGSGFYYNRPQSTTAKFANGTDPRDQKTQQFGASFGGPILKDKLFFFGAWDQQIQSTTIPITSALVTDPDIYSKYPKIGQTDTNYVQEQNGKVFFGRLDFQASDQHRIYGRANYSTYDGPNGTSSSQTQTTSHNGVEGLKSTSLVGSWNGIFSQNAINDFNIQYAKNEIPRADKGLGLPEIQLTGQATYGEVAFLPIVATDDRLSIGDTGTFLFGPHAVKIGADYNKTGMDQIFKGNWRGVFVFNYPTAALEKAAFLAGRWTQYREFVGLNGKTVDQAGRFNADQKELAFFAQDQWFVTSTLTVTLGLRYERLDNPDDPILDANKVLVPGAKNVQPDARIPDANNQWSPRLSLAWSPEKNAKSVVRLSLGRYWSRTPEILFSQLYQNNGLAGATYQVSANASGPTPGAPAPGWGAAFDPNSIQQLGSLPPGTNLGALGVFTIASDFKNPHTDKVTLGFEREILGIAWGLDGTWAKGYNLERMNDANLAPAPAANCPALDPNSGSACYGASPTSAGAEPDQLELQLPQGLHVGRPVRLQGRHAVVPQELRERLPVLRLPHPGLRLRHGLERAQLRRLHALGRQQPRAELGALGPRHPVARGGERLVRAQLRQHQHVLVRSVQLPDRPALLGLHRGRQQGRQLHGPRHDRRRRHGPQRLPPARLLHGRRPLRHRVQARARDARPLRGHLQPHEHRQPLHEPHELPGQRVDGLRNPQRLHDDAADAPVLGTVRLLDSDPLRSPERRSAMLRRSSRGRRRSSWKVPEPGENRSREPIRPGAFTF